MEWCGFYIDDQVEMGGETYTLAHVSGSSGRFKEKRGRWNLISNGATLVKRGEYGLEMIRCRRLRESRPTS